MSKSEPANTIEITARGVFHISTSRAGQTERNKIARRIRLRAIGKRESDGATFAQIEFQTMHGDFRSEFFAMSDLRPRNRHEVISKLADLGYEWPEDETLTNQILKRVANTAPKPRFRIVGAPGWHDSVIVRPGQVFAPRGSDNIEIYIDPKNDAHLAPFILGEGSLKGWQKHVAKPSRRSSCLRLSIAAALGALFLRPLGLDSFGINWFSDTSDGKSHALIVAASVAGLMGAGGLPSWADSESALEALAQGHRDCVMPLDETADGEVKTPIEKKARLLAFLIARNRARRLSPIYERSHNLTNREFRIIVLSTSERALGQIARAANARRLGGEEVRFMDIPASGPNSPGIFDGNIEPGLGKTLHETTKELIETLKVNAIKHQGYAFRELQERYVNDPDGLERLKTYKEQFERDALLPDEHNAYYRVRTNFAAMYAAAALAIDYDILPWKKPPTFRAIEKCMRLAFAMLATGAKEPAPAATAVDEHRLCKTLKDALATADLVVVKPKQKVTDQEVRARQKADGFKINGETYIKPDRFKCWVATHSERAALKKQKVILTGRDDTATVEKKIGGIKGKPRYYAIDVRALDRLAIG
jgi:uncharacterized protein (DUF927 family)